MTDPLKDLSTSSKRPETEEGWRAHSVDSNSEENPVRPGLQPIQQALSPWIKGQRKAQKQT